MAGLLIDLEFTYGIRILGAYMFLFPWVCSVARQERRALALDVDLIS